MIIVATNTNAIYLILANEERRHRGICWVHGQSVMNRFTVVMKDGGVFSDVTVHHRNPNGTFHLKSGLWSVDLKADQIESLIKTT